MKKIITTSVDGTAKFAGEFAETLKGGEVVGLIGDLGAGKTAFVQALAKALGVRERVTSPTFVYMHTHALHGQGKLRMLVHADAYRIDAEGLRGIGIEEYFGQPGIVTVIEWADRVKKLLPKGTILIDFKHLGGDKRSITVP